MARRRRAHRPGRLLLLLFAAISLVGLGYLFGQRASRPSARKTPAKSAPAAAPAGKTATAPTPKPKSPVRLAPAGGAPAVAGRIAIVVDDLGRSTNDVESLLALGVPLDYAVLPWERRTAEVVERLDAARAGGRVEILVHLPMESSGGENPGPNAIWDGLSPDRIAELTTKAIDAVPGAVGLNNHMGSRVTADPKAMGAVLDVVAARALWFLDSRTSADTVAFELARERAIPAARRDVFLDENPAPDAVEAEFDRLLALAAERGAAIAIGHPHEVTLAMLERRIPQAIAAGYELVPVSFLLERGETLP